MRAQIARAMAPRRDLPLRENPAGRALSWLSRALVCLAVVAFAVAAGAHGRLRQLALEPHLVTVALPPTAAGPASEAELSPAIEALRTLPGLMGLRVVPVQELLPMLPPGTSDGRLLAALPLPRLIEVAVDPRAAPNRSTIVARLATAAPEAVVGEPMAATAAAATSIGRLRLLGWAGGVLALMSLVAGSALVVRASLIAQRETVRLLRSLGADEAQVARQFEQFAARNGLRGALLGFVAAIALLVLFALIGSAWPEAELVEPRLALADWLRLVAVPVAAALLAAVAARLTVRLGLARLG